MDITTVLIGLIGSGGLGGLVFGLITIPQRRKLEQLTVDQKAIDQWKELYDRSEADGIRKSSLIDKLYEDLKEARRNENNATTENARLCILKCEKVDCTMRMPPLGYCSPNISDHGNNTEGKDNPA